jgi:hypothetical protein
MSNVVNPQRRRFHVRAIRGSPDGHPDLEWVLRGQVVKVKSREQADHAVGNDLGRFGEALVFGQLSVGQTVKAAPGPRDQPVLFQSLQVSAMDALSRRFTRAHYSGPLHHFQDSGGCGSAFGCPTGMRHSVTLTLHIVISAERL